MKKLNNILEIQEFLSIANETYIVEPYSDQGPKSEYLKRLESFNRDPKKKKKHIETLIKIEHPSAKDLKSEIGSAFDESDITQALGDDFMAAYEFIPENGIVYCEFQNTFWVKYDGELIRIM